MKKFFYNIFLDIFTEISLIQIEYQKLISKEITLENSINAFEIEIDFLNSMEAICQDEIDSLKMKKELTIEQQNELDNKKIHIRKLNNQKNTQLFFRNSYITKLETIKNNQYVLKETYPKYFRKMNF